MEAEKSCISIDFLVFRGLAPSGFKIHRSLKFNFHYFCKFSLFVKFFSLSTPKSTHCFFSGFFIYNFEGVIVYLKNSVQFMFFYYILIILQLQRIHLHLYQQFYQSCKRNLKYHLQSKRSCYRKRHLFQHQQHINQ